MGKSNEKRNAKKVPKIFSNFDTCAIRNRIRTVKIGEDIFRLSTVQ